MEGTLMVEKTQKGGIYRRGREGGGGKDVDR